jgi:hypothetical protein
VPWFPLGAADAAGAIGGPEEVDGDDLALGGVDDGAAVAGIGGRQAAGGVAEVAGVGIDAGVDDAHRLPFAEDPLAEDRRRLPAGEPRLADPDGGVVAQRPPPFEIDPENVAQPGERLAQGGDLGGAEQQADAGEELVVPRADDPLDAEIADLANHLAQVGVGVDLDHDRPDLPTTGLVFRRDRLNGRDRRGDLVERLIGAGPARAELGEVRRAPLPGRHLHQVGVVRQVGVDLEARLAQGLDLPGVRRRGELHQHDLVLEGILGTDAQGRGDLGLGPAGVDHPRAQRNEGGRPSLEARRGLLRGETETDGDQQQ